MISNKSYVLMLTLLVLAFVPAILLRDFNLVNELNYLGIAQDALDRGAFFTFYQNGVPYADKPPTYLWLCMFGLYFFGPHYAMSFLLLVSVLSLVFLIAILDRAFGSDFRHQERLLLMLGSAAMLFADVCALLGRMDMIFAAVMLLAYLKLIKRYSLIKTQKRNDRLDGHGHSERRGKLAPVKYGNLAIPLCLFAGIFIKGPYALIMPVVGLILVLLYNHDLKRFFVVFRPYYLLIILLLCALWALGVYAEGGSAYLENLFITQSAERLAGHLGHPEPVYYFLQNYPLLTLPIGLSALYFMGWHLYRAVQNRRLSPEQRPMVLSLKQQASLFFFLAVLLVVTIPSSKLEIYLLPGVLPLFYYVVLSYRQFHALHRGIDLSFEQDYLMVPESAYQRAYRTNNRELSAKSVATATASATATAASAASTAVAAAAVSVGNTAKASAAATTSDAAEPSAQALSKTHGSVQFHLADEEESSPQSVLPEASAQTKEEPLAERLQEVAAAEENLPESVVQAEEEETNATEISQHWGLEIEDKGFMLAGLKSRGERVPLPWLLSLSLLLPLLAYVGLLVAYVVLYQRIPQLQDPMVAIAFSVLAFCSLGAIFFLVNRLFLFALAGAGIATLGLVFFAGLAMPFLNNYLGVGSMVKQISEAVDQGANPQVCAFTYRNTYAIAVYDRRLELIADPASVDECLEQNFNVMFSRKAIRNFPAEAQRLQELGAESVGDNLLLLSHINQSSLSAPYAGSMPLAPTPTPATAPAPAAAGAADTADAAATVQTLTLPSAQQPSR